MSRNPDRPLSPHLTIWRWGPGMLVSILHRITGSGLSVVGLAVLTWWLWALADGPDAYQDFARHAQSWYGLVVLVGLTWAFAYGLLETIQPGSIRGLESALGSADFSGLLYFSYITQLTIGYGDITPVSAVARVLAVLEGLAGMIFTTVVLATLVAGYLLHRGDTGTR